MEALPIARRCHNAIVRGRAAELEAVGDVVAATVGAGGGVLIVDGAPGTGKSRLLGEAVTIARRNGMRVGAGAARPEGAPVALTALFAALFEGESPLLRRSSLDGWRGERHQHYGLLQELVGHLEARARDRPLLITLDDLHWADGGTLVALRTLVAGLEDAPVAWVVAMRGAEAGADGAALLDDLAPGGARRIALGGLDATAVAELAEDVLGGRPDAALTGLVARAGGIPGIVVDLLEGLVEDGLVRMAGGHARLVSNGMPHRLRAALAHQVDRLDPNAAHVVRVASVLGRCSMEQLAAMLDTTPAALLRPVQQAFRAELLRDDDGAIGFCNQLAGEAVACSLPPSVRRALHRQAADALRADGADAVLVAGHLAEGALPGDAAAVAGLRAASRELAGCDPRAAAEIGLRALEVARVDDPSRAALVAETVRLLQADLRPHEAEALAAAALDNGLPAEQEAEVRLGLAAVGSRAPADRAEENARALALDGVSEALRARHLAHQVANTALAGDAARAATLLAPARRATDGCGDRAAREALQVAAACIAYAGGDHRCAASLGGGGAAGELIACRASAAGGDLDGALRRAADVCARARRDRNAWLTASARSVRATLLLDAGKLEDAHAEAELVLAATAQAPRSEAAARASLVLGRVALHTDDARRLRLSLGDARERRADGGPGDRREASWLLALAAFERGRPREAVTWLEDDELPYAAPLDDVAHPATVVRIALAAGTRPLAEAAVAGARDRARRNPDSALQGALAAHAMALLDRDPGALLASAALLHDTGHRPALAAALEDASLASARRGRRAVAARCAAEALEVWEAAGARTDVRRIRRALRALGVHHRGPGGPSRPKAGWDSLTESELEVVRLVAAGHTNRQAAQRLVVSPHTVNTHVRHAFTKLAINSRVELARIALDRDAAGASAA